MPKNRYVRRSSMYVHCKHPIYLVVKLGMLLRSFEYFVTNASDQIARLIIVCDDNANFTKFY